jgi:hypothetical protein
MSRLAGVGVGCRGQVRGPQYNLLIGVLNNCERANALVDDILRRVAKAKRA